MPIVARGRDDDGDEHRVQRDGERVHDHGIKLRARRVFEQPAEQGAERRAEGGPAQPAEEGAGHQPHEVRESQSVRLPHGDGVIFVRHAEGNDRPLPDGEVRLQLLRDGYGHERVADVDDQHGRKQQAHIGALRDQVRAGDLSRPREVGRRDQDGEPGGEAERNGADRVGESDGHIAERDGQPVFQSSSVVHGQILLSE